MSPKVPSLRAGERVSLFCSAFFLLPRPALQVLDKSVVCALMCVRFGVINREGCCGQCLPCNLIENGRKYFGISFLPQLFSVLRESGPCGSEFSCKVFASHTLDSIPGRVQEKGSK